jgi:ABC-type bacteriocin/lantibiotic exporter with double-glycine peptidase domain
MVIIAHYLSHLIFICFRIENLSTRYRENIQLVLKDLSIHIEPGEKVRSVFLIGYILNKI